MSEELTKTKLLPIQGKDMDSIMQNLETGVAELFTSQNSIIILLIIRC